ncbi:hypothetical protein [Bradyrhizobium sp. ORS 111]|uniref:hypothetical protein n=1 Tax=Bradyrhizobium sp. ORS 111 TaxID=1685958 RepID=UPI00388F71B0
MIRHNSDGLIAPQLGQASQKGNGRLRKCRFFQWLSAGFRTDREGMLAKFHSLASVRAMGETRRGLSAFQAADHSNQGRTNGGYG